MTEEAQRFEAQIAWPSDTYAGAGVANFISMSDDGQGVYLAFGHIPPFPVGVQLPASVVPNVQSSVYLTYKNTAELAELLNQYIAAKSQQPADES